MGTTIKGSSELSMNPGSRLENCVNNFSGFENINPLERVVPALEKTPHQSEGALAEQGVSQLLNADWVGAERAPGVLRIKPASPDVPTHPQASHPHRPPHQLQHPHSFL